MKKIYQNPEMTIVNVQMSQMIAASDELRFGSSVNTASGAESREGRFFDDDEDY